MSKAKQATVQAAPALAPASLPATPLMYKGTINGSDTITVNVANPKRGKSRDVFAMYVNGQTVDTFKASVVAAGLRPNKAAAHGDLRWDLARQYITLTPAS